MSRWSDEEYRASETKYFSFSFSHLLYQETSEHRLHFTFEPRIDFSYPYPILTPVLVTTLGYALPLVGPMHWTISDVGSCFPNRSNIRHTYTFSILFKMIHSLKL